MYVTVSERFIEAVNYLTENRYLRNQAELTGKLELSKGYVSQIVSGKREPSETIVRKFANEFPMISMPWLLTGEGEMLVKSSNNQKIYDNKGMAVNGNHIEIKDRTGKELVNIMQTATKEMSQYLEALTKKDNTIDTLIAQNGKLMDIINNLTKK